jgi:hypothetical protein
MMPPPYGHHGGYGGMPPPPYGAGGLPPPYGAGGYGVGGYGGMPPPPYGAGGLPPPAYGGAAAPPPPPVQPLTMVAPASAFQGEAGRYGWYRVAFVGGVDLRHGPSVEAPRTSEMLCQNATFAAAEELMGADGRVYLRLADGRGWAFDDSALFPHDPSVMRGYWQPIAVAPKQQ